MTIALIYILELNFGVSNFTLQGKRLHEAGQTERVWVANLRSKSKYTLLYLGRKVFDLISALTMVVGATLCPLYAALRGKVLGEWRE
ncbi:MAG: hypothetical protein KDB03_10900 [Planctomycetales bacterium]|nr:hypothetical protein [Planctomycetales bacterium]